MDFILTVTIICATVSNCVEWIPSGDSILGKIAIASKQYELEDTVLVVEQPAYTFDPATRYPGMLQAFLDASEGQRADIVSDMYS